MSKPIEYIPAYLAPRRYFIYTPISKAQEVQGYPTRPVEVSKLWYYWCKWRKWRYQPNYNGSFLVKINRFTRWYCFEENWENPSFADVFGEAKRTLRRLAR